ncbi:putative G-protein coupled receptor 33 [Leptodactylus fuscus]
MGDKRMLYTTVEECLQLPSVPSPHTRYQTMVHTNNSEFQVTLPDESLYPEITASNLISTIILLITCLYGLVMNSLYIWILRFRISQSINTTWFFHLVMTNVIFTLHLPLLAAYVLKYPLWIFGDFICKLNDMLYNIHAHAAAFILTAIGLDRLLLVYFPIWYRKHMTLHRASIICLTMWGVAILCSLPYLVLCHVEPEGNITVCCSEFFISWNEDDPQKLDLATAWGLYSFRLALSFVLPFGQLSICYLFVSLKIRTRRLAKSTKPYKLILLVVASFLICWTPYHVLNGMLVEKVSFPEQILELLIILTVGFACINSCLTPILYLFIVDSFNKEFRKSVRLLVSLAFRLESVSQEQTTQSSRERELQ